MTWAGIVKLFTKLIRRVWKAVIATLEFAAVLEDRTAGQPRRISQTRVMVWGSMLVGGLLIGRLTLTGEPISITESGIIGLLTIAAGLIKARRDALDERSGRGRWGGDEDDPFDPPSNREV